MNYRVAIFDLDDTLYPSSTGLFTEIKRRIRGFIQNQLNLSEAAAVELQQRYINQYGSSLGGLIATGQAEEDTLLRAVFDIPVSRFLRPNPALLQALESLPVRKVIFTYAPREFVSDVLRTLAVEFQFEDVYDCRRMGFHSKSDPATYRDLLGKLEVSGTECLLFDDSLPNLHTAIALGVTAIWIKSEGVDEAEVPEFVFLHAPDVVTAIHWLLHNRHL